MSSSEMKIQLFRTLDKLSQKELQEVFLMMNKWLTSKEESVHDQGRKVGFLSGTLKFMAPDFNEPLDDFQAYM